MFEVVFKLGTSSIVTVLFGFFVMYNKKFIEIFQNSKVMTNKKFQTIFGNKIRTLNRETERIAYLNEKSIRYKIYRYLKTIIENLDMEEDNVTPVGLVIFISSISFIITVLGSAILETSNMIIPLYVISFYLILVLFRFVSLTKYEKREEDIMSAIDLLVPDIKSGVENSIRKYKNQFKPSVRVHFKNFLDDIDNKGYGFKDAMLKLGDKLGYNFADFCRNAILYEEKADDTSDTEFSTIIEIHSKKRERRYKNKISFNKTKTELIVSMFMIVGYCIFSVYQDQFMMDFFLHKYTGKLLMLVNIGMGVFAIAHLTKIKAQSL